MNLEELKKEKARLSELIEILETDNTLLGQMIENPSEDFDDAIAVCVNVEGGEVSKIVGNIKLSREGYYYNLEFISEHREILKNILIDWKPENHYILVFNLDFTELDFYTLHPDTILEDFETAYTELMEQRRETFNKENGSIERISGLFRYKMKKNP